MEEQKEKQKSPYLALFLSGILPAGGQFYNRNHLKAAFFLPLQSGLVIGTLVENKRVNKSWQQYQNTDSMSDYERYSESYEKRQNLLWWTGVVWALSMADAYISAHFYHFNEGSELILLPDKKEIKLCLLRF
ncbi:MAG: DUF5683 domain-containing protein [Candidatus Edwardsbacteria bacterium]